MPVEELAPVVAVEPENGKSQRRLDLRNPLPHSVLALVPKRPRLRPLGVHVRHRQAPAEVPRHRLPAVGHRIRLHPSRPLHIPVFGAHGNLLAQQRPGPGAAPVSFSKADTAGRKQTVDGCRAEALQPGPEAVLQPPKLLLVVWQPHPKGRLQTLAAGLLGCQPDLLEDPPLRLPVDRLRAPALSARTGYRSFAAQDLHRVFALVSAQRGHLIQQPAPAFPPSTAIAFPGLVEHFLTTLLTPF